MQVFKAATYVSSVDNNSLAMISLLRMSGRTVDALRLIAPVDTTVELVTKFL